MDGLFGAKHLIGLAWCIGLSAILFIVLHFFVNKKESGKIWTLRGICLALILVEFIKYIVILRGDGIKSGSIGHGLFPFHLCSMGLYLFPFVAFGKSKFSEFLKPAAFVIGLLGGLLTLLYPSNVLDVSTLWLAKSGFNFPLISFVYHTIMIDFAIYMIVSKNYSMKAIDALKAIAVILVLASVAIILNSLIPGADYFLIGKGYGSPLAFIIEKTNLFVYILTMFAISIIVIVLLYSIAITKYLIQRKKYKQST